jgi:uncharacterized membrane protein
VALPALIAVGLAWFLAWLFGQAAYHKLSSPQYYQPLVKRYLPVAPASNLPVLAVGALEGCLALALLLPASRTPALAVAAGLLLVYAGLMARQVARGGAHMACGCAGPDSALQVSWALVSRNGVCCALALLAMSSAGDASSGWTDMGLSLFVAVFAALVYLTCEQIISNAQWMAGEG